MVALQQSEQENAHLLLIDQVQSKQNVSFKHLSSWSLSPFASVQIATTKLVKLGDKLFNRKRQLAQLTNLITQIAPTKIYTGNDRRIEFQCAMHHANQLQPCAGVYVDDGACSYRDKVVNRLMDKLNDKLAKAFYGAWRHTCFMVGNSPWTEQCYLVFPELARADFQSKVCKTLPSLFNHPAMQALSSKYLSDGVDLSQLQQADYFLTLPHSAVFDKVEDYRQQVLAFIDRVDGKLLVKYHPRQAVADPLGLKELAHVELVDRQVPFEFVLPYLATDCEVVGDVSTTLLSVKWLRPEIAVSVFRQDKQNQLAPLFEKLSINPLRS